MLAKKPPMGFNTWNTFGENINEEVILQTADKMVELGLRDAGYEYLVIDDCWSEHVRDKITGKIVPDHIKFPHGMKYVSDYVHAKGLKFGMYSDCGVYTCAGYPASFDHELLDAQTFAEYGADYLKYDNGYRPTTANGRTLYRRMAMALRNCGRDIVFSACQWGEDEPHTWLRGAGADLYRSTGDIVDTFESMKEIALSQMHKLYAAGPGLWNDTDMLTVGMHGHGNVGGADRGMTDIEYRTEMAIWSFFQAPLMIGCDLRRIDDECLRTLKNPYLLRINQDEDGRPPYIARDNGERAVLFKLLSGNEVAILMLNLTDRAARNPSMFFEDVGIPAAWGKGLRLTDCFTGDVKYCRELIEEEIEPHDCKCYIGTLE